MLSSAHGSPRARLPARQRLLVEPAAARRGAALEPDRGSGGSGARGLHLRPGTLPGLSLAEDAPLGSEIPIDTIVVAMFENRSFDHMLGHLPDVGVSDADVAPAGSANAASDGSMVPWHQDAAYCFCDTNHEWDGSHLEYGGGKNDGFVLANENNFGCPPDGTRAMTYYTAQDIPFFYGLAQSYAISDRHFCSLLGPTFPNREYLYAATSYGRTTNAIFKDSRATIVDQLDQAGVNWGLYYQTLPGLGIFLNTFTSHLSNTMKFSSLTRDAQAGQLPQVTFVDPDLRGEDGFGNDFHPPGDVQNPAPSSSSWSRCSPRARSGRTWPCSSPSTRTAGSTTMCRRPRPARPTTTCRSTTTCSRSRARPSTATASACR
jgi:phospholipase C